ncbi:MAG TPA: hypothetical protein VGH38_13180 [Bryobacteraceae bacterium]
MGHFLARMVAPSASSEFELGAGFLLGLLATPGTFYCFLLFQKFSSLLNWMRGSLHEDVYLTSIPDKYVLISIAMAVTGIVTVLKWDQLLPDSQDYLNLAPLPIRPRNILLANATAILAAVLVLALDVSAVPAVLFPLFVMASAHAPFADFVHFGTVHAVCVLLASLFTICGVFAILGTLSAILPREAFRACSSWIRGILLIALLMLLPSGFAGTALVRTLLRHPDSLLRFLPPLWYLGLYQSLQHRASPVLIHLGRVGLAAVPAVFALMAVTYAFSYRRRFAGVLEGGRRPSEQRLFAVVLAVLDLFARGASGFGRACHEFAVRALLRNETHRLAISVSLGLGWLLAIQEVANALPAVLDRGGQPAIALLEAPLVAVYLLVLGLRLAIELPAGLSANWIFRTVLDPRENETLPVARRVIFSFLIPVVVLPALAFSWWAWGIGIALFHVLYLLTVSLCLIEIQFAGYRKIPLTCPMPGFRDNLLMLCLVQFLGFEFFTRAGAAMEHWMIDMPLKFLLLPAAMAGAWYWNRQRIADAREAGELEEGVMFENVAVRAVERLNLSDGM